MKTNILKTWLSAGCLLLGGLLAPSAQATTWYVSKNGSNSGGSTWSKAWNDFDDIAWTSISPGDLILVDGGPSSGSMTYTARIKPTRSGTSSLPIRIERSTESGRDGIVRLFGGRTGLLPKGGSSPLSGESSVRTTPIDFRSSAWITIDGKKWGGIKVDGWKPEAEDKGAIMMRTGTNGVTLRYMEITNNGFTSNADGANTPKGEGISLAGSTIVIDHCEIHDNGADALQTYSGVSNLSVTNSWLHNNSRDIGWNSSIHPDGIQLNGSGPHPNVSFENTVFGPGLYHGLIISASSPNLRLTNCLIDRPLTSPIKVNEQDTPGFKMDFTTIYYENNVSYDHRVLEMAEAVNPTITNSIVQGTNPSWTNSISGLTKSNNYSYKVGGTRIDNGTDVNPQFTNKGTVSSSPKTVNIANEDWRPLGPVTSGGVKAGFKFKNALDLKGSGGSTPPPSSSTPTVSVSVSNSSIPENGGTTRITVTRDVTDVGMNINYTTSGAAVYGTDFTSGDHTFDGNIWLEAGASRRDIDISTLNNSAYSTDKAFTLQLTSGTGYQVSTASGASTAAFTIVNDDIPQAVPYPSASLPASIPGTLQAENYDVINAGGSGEGITYHDVTSTNQGGAYRTSEGVDVSNVSGITYVSYTRDGEWVLYSVRVATAGVYKVRFRVANNTTAGTVTSLRLKLDDRYITDDVTIAPTGSWTTYTDVEVHGLQLAATPSGQTQKLRLEFVQSSPDASAPNVDYLQFSADDIHVMSNVAVADAYVRDGTYQNSNFGTESLITYKLGQTADFNREIFVRFDLTPYAGLSFTKATAVLHVVNIDEPDPGFPSMDFGVSVLSSNPSWSETGITWVNSRSYASTSPVYAPVQDGENRFDLTQAVVDAQASGKTSLTIKLISRYSDAARVDMDSREGAVKPRLEVEY